MANRSSAPALDRATDLPTSPVEAYAPTLAIIVLVVVAAAIVLLPFDYRGLFDAIGSDAVVEQRLDRFFKKLVCWGEPCFNMANEPDFVTPYAYTFLGKPAKTAAIVTRIENEIFNTTPGGIPGNDDLGIARAIPGQSGHRTIRPRCADR